MPQQPEPWMISGYAAWSRREDVAPDLETVVRQGLDDRDEPLPDDVVVLPSPEDVEAPTRRAAKDTETQMREAGFEVDDR